MSDRLAGRRILVTSCASYMGPAITELFRAEGAEVVANDSALLDPNEPADLVGRCGTLDAIIANLDLPAYGAKVADIDDEQWVAGFDAMVHPLMRLVRAAAPAMVVAGVAVVRRLAAPRHRPARRARCAEHRRGHPTRLPCWRGRRPRRTTEPAQFDVRG